MVISYGKQNQNEIKQMAKRQYAPCQVWSVGGVAKFLSIIEINHAKFMTLNYDKTSDKWANLPAISLQKISPFTTVKYSTFCP
ncbi:hypothetical protein [Moraxella marmotae]|uniref:hypothetical protein n=1 Tax=Moraxella marmotae TaxID=3344520 RepID=UPI0035F3A32E